MMETIKSRLDKLEAQGGSISDWVTVIYQDGSQRRFFGAEVIAEALEHGEEIIDIKGNCGAACAAEAVLPERGVVNHDNQGR